MDNTEADELLARWGSWSRNNDGNGFASTSLLYRMWKESAGASHDRVFDGIAMADDIAQCEKIITDMNRPMKRMTKCKYLWGLTIEEGRKRMGYTESTYRRRIVAIQEFIADRFI